MSKENLNLLNLFKEKKYSEIIFKIEQIKKEEINPSLLNLLGVCRMLSTNSIETIKLAIEDFKKSYYLEKDKTKTKDTIKNLINASSTLFDKEYIKNERNLGSDFFEEIDLIYQQNKQIFDNDVNLLKAISKVMKRTSDAKSTIQYLRKILNLHSDPDTIASYNFFNNYIFDWKQSDYYQNSKKINQKLPIFSSGELINLKFSKKEKINIGFVSSDIRSKHSITYFLKTVLLFYNQEKFKIYLYHNHNLINDPSTIELNNLVSNFSYVNTLKDTEVINKIREDEIDIIIDLNGFSSNHRLALFKNRLAPIQISWCGYTNTTGLDEMDYLLVDRNLIRPEEEKYYSEKIIYLPNIWNCHSGYPYQRSENLMPMETNNYITFGSFNNFRKINDEVIERVIGQTIIYYPISLEHTNFHSLYGEALDKSFLDPIRVYAMVKWESQNTTTTPLGVDRIEKISVAFHKRRLTEDQDLFVREGDFVQYGENMYEILSLQEPKWLFGQVESSFEIAASCVRAREGLFNVRDN